MGRSLKTAAKFGVRINSHSEHNVANATFQAKTDRKAKLNDPTKTFSLNLKFGAEANPELYQNRLNYQLGQTENNSLEEDSLMQGMIDQIPN